jgi:DNA-binding NarL/FixJ family response regulator
VPGKPRIRILIADDHQLFAEALGLALDADPRLEVVGYARDGQEVVELARALDPDVILMDLEMPVLDGVTATRRLLKTSPARIAILTASARPEDAVRARDAGASTYLTKGCSAGKVVDAVVELAAPETPGFGLDPLQFRATLAH